MIKKMCVAVALVSALSGAVAAPVDAPLSFNLAGVPVVTFLQATYKSVLNRDYVIAPEVLAMEKRFTISVRDLPAAAAPAFVDDLLMGQGIQSQKRGEIYYLTAAGAYPVAAADAFGAVVGPAVPVSVERPIDIAPVPAGVANSVQIYTPLHRPAEFMVAVINSAYRQPFASVAGSQVVLSVAPERFDDVLKLAQALDLAVHSVDVQASFVEVMRSDSGNGGLSLVASVLGAKFGAAVGSVGTGSGSVSIGGKNFQAVLSALQADGRFKQVSNSRVLGDDAKNMTLTVGDETPTVSSSGMDNAGNSVQNIVYRPSGVILDVLPTVLGSGRVSLLVDGQISSFQATSTGVTGSPTLVKRQVKTSVTVNDGEVVIIGGLDDTKSSYNRSGFSFLPRSWAGAASSDTHTDLVLILSAKASKPASL
ncbi:MAG: hypothetical protein Q8R69_18775 [Telluria sp.]|nr:hypothetical protein [Telluria sp.]